MKPIKNFTDHPGMKYDSTKYVFTTGKLHLLTEEEVKEIVPVRAVCTNMGDPFRQLARFIYLLGQEEGCVDISFRGVIELKAMCKSIGFELPLDKDLQKHIDRLEED